jgi:transcriptional regulator with XRE-family HTH domain
VKKTIHSPEYSELIKWLRTQRKQRGITMRELGEKLDVIHSWVGKIEQGERRLDIVEYLRICSALEIDPHAGIELLQKKISSSDSFS